MFLAIVTACQKSPNSVGAPVLPPSTSMDMAGLSSFTSQQKSTSVSTDSSNFKRAWKIVQTWDSISVKLVLTPKLIFMEALNGKNAVYDADNKQWTWTYIKTIAGDGSYQAILTGKTDNDSVHWTMTVSRIDGDGLYHFKWFEGQTDIKQTGGWWTLYDPVSKEADLLINWKKESNLVQWIQYTNIVDTNPDKGNYIKYGTTDATDYNAYFNISFVSSGATANIEWNTTTFAGQLIYLGKTYGWDSNMNNKKVSE
jgi:hypothetical protein